MILFDKNCSLSYSLPQLSNHQYTSIIPDRCTTGEKYRSSSHHENVLGIRLNEKLNRKQFFLSKAVLCKELKTPEHRNYYAIQNSTGDKPILNS